MNLVRSISTLFPYTTLFRSVAAALARPEALPAAVPIALLWAAEPFVAYALRAARWGPQPTGLRSEEHTYELQSRLPLVCRPLPVKKKTRGLAAPKPLST